MKTPVNSRTLKQHLTYNWWKYVLALIAGTFLVNLLFTVTNPRIPEDKRVDFYIYGYVSQERLQPYMDTVHREQMPDMESLSFVTMIPDDAYGPMQLTTYVAVQEGDLYLLPREQFLSLSGSGAFLPLEDQKDLMDFFTEKGLDLRRGWRTLQDSSETHLFGIPAEFLPDLSNFCLAEDGFLCVLINGGNAENTLKFLRILCDDMSSGKYALPEKEPTSSPVPANP